MNDNPIQGTSAARIRARLEAGKEHGATPVVIKTDTFSNEDYPVYVMPGRSAEIVASDNGEMEKTMEVYDLSKSIDDQLKEDRASDV